MSFRAWVFAVAFGLAAVGSGYAQDEAGQAPDRSSQQEQPANSATPGIPVRIIEDPETAIASESRETEAHENQKLDLIAQQRMADATEAMNNATQSMMWAAWVSAFFVFAGTCLLVWTLWLTRQANKAAQSAVDVTREIGRAQVRAYLSLRGGRHSVGFNGDPPKLSGIFIVPKIRNSGQSPARLVSLENRPILTSSTDGHPPRLTVSRGKAIRNADIGAGIEHDGTKFLLTADMVRGIFDGSRRYFIMIWGEYYDVFQDPASDRPHELRQCLEVNIRLDPDNIDPNTLTEVFLDYGEVSDFEVIIEQQDT